MISCLRVVVAGWTQGAQDVFTVPAEAVHVVVTVGSQESLPLCGQGCCCRPDCRAR